jgi:hypothetical protein
MTKKNRSLFTGLPALAWLIVMTISFATLEAQVTVHGSVSDAQAKPLPQANVLLLRAKDSVMVKGMVTASNGGFRFENIAGGQYLLLLSFTGYENKYSAPFTLTTRESDLGSFSLQPADKALNSVTVTARKPMFEQKIDRMVINVRNSITAAGGTALEVLERSPGVFVNRQNNTIAINGKDGVVVMINGKINNMPLSAVVQLLSGMNASNIERIELITTPPSNLDAEGNAGYINIVLVNNPNQGINGSWSVTAGYGLRETPAAGVNFNYRHKRLNLYGDYSFSRQHRIQLASVYRRVNNQGQTKETNSDTWRNTIQQNHNIRLGMDYQLSPKTTAGALVATYNNRWSMYAENNILKQTDHIKDTTLFITNDEVNHWRHFMANVNMQHTIKENESISMDLTYLWYHDDNPNNYTNNYYNAAGDFLFAEQTMSGKVTPINIKVGNVDYKKKLSDKTNLETGVKATISRFTNDVTVGTKSGGGWVYDPAFTAKYLLKENIGAAYASVNITLNEKTSLKTGLRYEYTTSNLGTTTVANIVDRKYGRLFPTFFLSRKMDENNTFNISYTRRITRPTFNDLAPFLIFFDPNTFISGNSGLQPAFTDNVKADYIFKNYTFSLGYSYETSTIAGFQDSVDVKSNKQYIVARNLDYTKMITAVIGIPISVTNWWSMNTNITATWQQVHTIYNKLPVTVAQFYVNLSGSQNFRLPKNYSIELSGFYYSPSLWGTSKAEPFGAFNISAQKKFNDNSTLRLGVSDVFTSLNFRSVSDRPEQNFYTRTQINFSQRIFRLTYTRNFGNNELRAKRNRSTGSEEETERVRQQ